MTDLKSRALFLDRDGVINVEMGYTSRPEEIKFVDRIFELARRAQKLHYKIVVVTNQSGIGRGYFTEDDFTGLTRWMNEQFIKNGCSIDATYHCPFHPTEGIGDYRRESNLRKPNPGMILQAVNDFSLDPSMCVLIGDRLSDIAAGRAAGVRHNFLLSAKTDVEEVEKEYVVSGLLAVVDFISSLEG